MLASSLVVLLVVYGAGLARVWRSAGFGHGIRRSEALAFIAGWTTIALALSPRVDELADTWQFAHMVQHELLMVVAAPLVAAGAPLIVLLWAVPGRLRRRGLEFLRRRPITLAWAFLTAPASVFVRAWDRALVLASAGVVRLRARTRGRARGAASLFLRHGGALLVGNRPRPVRPPRLRRRGRLRLCHRASRRRAWRAADAVAAGLVRAVPDGEAGA